jgi:nucleotide-binding universal stress UspA family protein
MSGSKIVVGVDGSAGATAAVRWAAVEAALRGAELRVLTAYQREVPGRDFTASGQLQRAADDAAAAIVEAAVTQARSMGSSLDVRGSAVVGYPAPVLLRAGEDADLLVVGNRGRGGFAGLPFGSVGSQVATHATVSVAVVRGRAQAATGPVVVGVDDSPTAETTVGLAFAEAALRRDAALLAVTAYGEGFPPMPVGVPLFVDEATIGKILGSQLTAQLAPWRAKYPDVPAEYEVVPGDAAAVLVQKSQQARLVVVGPRGRGGFDGLLLGSVGAHLVQRADCPVLVAR